MPAVYRPTTVSFTLGPERVKELDRFWPRATPSSRAVLVLIITVALPIGHTPATMTTW